MTTTALTTDPTTDTTPHDQDDQLKHIICSRCAAKAKAHAKPVRAICGKTKYGWNMDQTFPPPAAQCVVCVAGLNKSCEGCGRYLAAPKG